MTTIDGSPCGQPGATLETCETAISVNSNGAERGQSPQACMTIAAYLPLCLAEWSSDATLMEPETVSLYQRTFEIHILPFMGDLRLIDVGPAQIKAFKRHLKQTMKLTSRGTPAKNGKKLSPRTRQQILGILSCMFSLALEDGFLLNNPLHCRTKRQQREVTAQKRSDRIAKCKALTLEERDRVLLVARWLLNALRYAYICLLVGTGLRPGEARVLRWQDLDLTGQRHGGVPMVEVHATEKKASRITSKESRGKKKPRRIGVPKGKYSRSVELDPTLVELFTALWNERQPSRNDFIFVNEQGIRWSENEAKGEWPFLLALAGIMRWLPLYCLRHTYASILLSEGSQIHGRDTLVFVSRQLGHSSTTITEDAYANWLEVKSHGVLQSLHLGQALQIPPVTRQAVTSRRPTANA